MTLKEQHLTLFRPIMEYAAPVWDPYYNVDIHMLRAAQWILSEYSRISSVKALLSIFLKYLP